MCAILRYLDSSVQTVQCRLKSEALEVRVPTRVRYLGSELQSGTGKIDFTGIRSTPGLWGNMGKAATVHASTPFPKD